MKRGKIWRTPRAQQDIVEQAYYFAETDMNTSDKFIYAVENTFRTLAAMPEMGSPRTFRHSRLRGLRSWSVEGFRKHLIFYLPRENGIEVIRVLHGSRDLDALFGEETESD